MNALPSLRAAALLAALFASGAAQAACYFVYGPDQELIYRSNRVPVDLSQPLHQTVPALAPGARLVFSLDELLCAVEINRLAERRAEAAWPSEPQKRAAGLKPQGS